MSGQQVEPQFARALRSRAEAKSDAGDGRVTEHLSLDASNALIHELRVHQIELEMQNEELRQAMVALEASRERYFELYDLAPLGYLTISEKGLILEANLAAASLLGETRSTLVKQPLSRFILPEDLGRYFQQRQRLLATGRSQRCDLQLLAKDGSLSWARLEATLEHEPGGAHVIRAALSDVNQLKAVEKSLSDKTATLDSTVRKLTLIAKLLPVCRDCMRIRDENNQWHSLDEALSRVAENQPAKTICDECLRHLGPNTLDEPGEGLDKS
jgi:PAS domain S-box-containing protein